MLVFVFEPVYDGPFCGLKRDFFVVGNTPTVFLDCLPVAGSINQKETEPPPRKLKKSGVHTH